MKRKTALGQRALMVFAGLFLTTACLAQRLPAEEGFWKIFEARKSAHKALQFEAVAKTPGIFTSFNNRLITPLGQGPFPTVVLMPSCAGVNVALEARAKELLAANFAVLAVDSYGPRGKNHLDCGPMFMSVLLDTFDALQHLQKFEAVNKQRIFVAGWSTGAAGALFSSSPSGSQENGVTLRFRAAVSHYANCMYQDAPKAVPAPVLRRDTDHPLLMLIAETDVAVSNCFPLLEEMKATNNPVEWHVLKGAAHLWDRPDDTRGSRKNGFGQTIVLRYSPEATLDATQRTIEFFNRFK